MQDAGATGGAGSGTRMVFGYDGLPSDKDTQRGPGAELRTGSHGRPCT